jgi:two-component system LytT family sensor kinase
MIEVEDDGVGIAPGRQRSSGVLTGTGIGMKNVRERLEVLFGDAAHFDVTSRPGRGTKVTLGIPVREGHPIGTYSAASSTRL